MVWKEAQDVVRVLKIRGEKVCIMLTGDMQQ
jgi:cation transport ATPase